MELRDVAATAAICTAFGIFGYLFQFCLRFLFEIKSPDGEPISFWGEAALVVVGALALYVLVGALWVVGEALLWIVWWPYYTVSLLVSLLQWLIEAIWYYPWHFIL